MTFSTSFNNFAYKRICLILILNIILYKRMIDWSFSCMYCIFLCTWTNNIYSACYYFQSKFAAFKGTLLILQSTKFSPQLPRLYDNNLYSTCVVRYYYSVDTYVCMDGYIHLEGLRKSPKKMRRCGRYIHTYMTHKRPTTNISGVSATRQDGETKERPTHARTQALVGHLVK